MYASNCTAQLLFTLSIYIYSTYIIIHYQQMGISIYTLQLPNVYRGFVTNLMVVIIKYYIRDLTRPVKLKTWPRGNCPNGHIYSFSFTDLVRWWHNCQCT